MATTNPITKRINELWRLVRRAEKSGDNRAALAYSRHLNDLLVRQDTSNTPIASDDINRDGPITIAYLDSILEHVVVTGYCHKCHRPIFRYSEILPRPIKGETFDA